MALGESAFCEKASYLSAAAAFICGRRRMTGRALLKKKKPPEGGFWMEPRPKGGRVHGSRGSVIVHGTHRRVCTENRTFHISSTGKKRSRPKAASRVEPYPREGG